MPHYIVHYMVHYMVHEMQHDTPHDMAHGMPYDTPNDMLHITHHITRHMTPIRVLYCFHTDKPKKYGKFGSLKRIKNRRDTCTPEPKVTKSGFILSF